MLAYLFPGQGSQAKGMGKDLFKRFPEYTAQADNILGYSIEHLCTQDPDQLLNNTRYTQPALYVVNALTYLKTVLDTGQKPDYVAGHSLGEYNALFAAEVFDFTTGLILVKKRGELMNEAKAGGMLAVLGLNVLELTQALASNNLQTVTIANYNSYKQLVLSGLAVDISKAEKVLESMPKARVIPLAVSGAFHSGSMLEAQQLFSVFLEQFEFSVPRIPIISNINATLYHPAVIKQNLCYQITHAVEWTKTIEFLQSKTNIIFKEIGPGTVLSGLLRRIANGE
jgi:malonyl CoA-acyl carrier protein transacylase